MNLALYSSRERCGMERDRFCSLLVAIICCYYVNTAASAESSPRRRILADKVYKDRLVKETRPEEPGNNATIIRLHLIVQFMYLDERKSFIFLNSLAAMKWKDTRLAWNPKEYGNLTYVYVPFYSIWQPDLRVYNSGDHSRTYPYSYESHYLKFDGTVMWAPTAFFESYCSLDFKKWPFDVQFCRVIVGSWTHHGWQLDIRLPEKNPAKVSLEQCLPNVEWSVANATAYKRVTYYSCCNEPYLQLEYDFTLKRNSASYAATVFVPALILVLLTISGFLLSPVSSERIILGMFNVVYTSTYLLYLHDVIPNNGNTPPLIILYFRDALLMGVVFVIYSVLLRNLMTVDILNDRIHNLRLWIQKATSKQQTDENSEEAENNTKNTVTADPHWLEHMLDRLMLFIYLVVYMIFIVAFL